MPYQIIITLCFVALFTGCSSSEIGQSKDVNQQRIYQAYEIVKTEGSPLLEVQAQYRFAGEYGTTLTLSSPANIVANEQALQLDSSEISGAFYSNTLSDTRQQIALRYTDLQKSIYLNEVSLPALTFATVPAAVNTSDLCLHFSGVTLEAEDFIEINSHGTDSAFSVIYNGEAGSNCITIPAEYLKKQQASQLQIQAVLYKKIALQQATTEGGIISYQYRCKPIVIMLQAEPIQASLAAGKRHTYL
jgi:hypothetical protein